MKKLFLAIFLIVSMTSLSFATKPKFPIEAFTTKPTENSLILQKWFKDNKIVGRTVSSEQEFKNFPHFPTEFTKFKIRIIKNNSVVTMDYSSERINVTLDENEKIAQVFIG